MTQKNPWWKQATIYQIYPKSFQDSNGDGTGDLQGIIQRLDYLKDLGIDAIWLCPVFCSPQNDNGYDISDYMDIDPIFGSLSDMDDLISQAKKRGIRIILDLVLNHSSDEHPWFREAKKNKASPYHDYYIWRDGTPEIPPNNMHSAFGGSAWTWVPEVRQYYFHQFSSKQPDLNWENSHLRDEIFRIVNFWIARGVGGFRLDVIDQIAKEPDKKITNNGPRLHDYIRELNQKTFGGTDLVTVGETWGATPELAKLFSNPDGSEFSMVFQFEHMMLDQIPGKEKWDLCSLDLLQLKRVLTKWQKELYQTGWNSLFWNNHDLPRIVSRWGDDGKYRVESAKMLATLLYGMQGTPFLYQGEELGMTNVHFSENDYVDIETRNMIRERKRKGYSNSSIMQSVYAKGRDNARTPMQWDDSANAGFTTGMPWIKVNPNYTEINAQTQISNESSVFSYYKKIIALRKQNPIFWQGDYELLLPDDPNIYAYRRSWNGQRMFVVCNFHGEECLMPQIGDISQMQLLISNYDNVQVDEKLHPYDARIYMENRFSFG